jgi:ribosomal protein S18 acetylase RimI-like enzyme
MPIRPFHGNDIPSLTQILRETDVFRDEEIAVAVELMQIAADDPGQKEYTLSTYVDDNGRVCGYYCVGPTPMTQSTFDLYWIAVAPEVQGKGIGRELLKHCEALIRSQGGKLVMVETSSQPKYEGTRSFYLRHHYAENARVRDYYAPGDDLVVYTKHFVED